MKLIFTLFIHIIIVSAVIFLFWRLRVKKNKSPKPVKVPRGYKMLTIHYLNIHNDYMRLYYKKQYVEWYITDLGETISVLEASGLLDDSKGKELLGNILKDSPLLRSGAELYLTAVPNNIDRKYNDFADTLREITTAFEAYMQERK